MPSPATPTLGGIQLSSSSIKDIDISSTCGRCQFGLGTSHTRKVFAKMVTLTLVATAFAGVLGLGHVTLPASTRNGGSMATGGSCTSGQCFWFSNNVEIPGEPTLPNGVYCGVGSGASFFATHISSSSPSPVDPSLLLLRTLSSLYLFCVASVLFSNVSYVRFSLSLSLSRSSSSPSFAKTRCLDLPRRMAVGQRQCQRWQGRRVRDQPVAGARDCQGLRFRLRCCWRRSDYVSSAAPPVSAGAATPTTRCFLFSLQRTLHVAATMSEHPAQV